MKKPKSAPTIKTIPEGAYETGTTNHGLRSGEESHPASVSTDLQGNGYPDYREHAQNNLK